MTEPTSTAVTAGAVSMLGVAGASAALPDLSGVFVILACAVAGGALQLSTAIDPRTSQPYTRLGAAFYLLVTAGMAFALTGAIAYCLTRWLDLPKEIVGMPVAFVIGARREWVLTKFTGMGDKVIPTDKGQTP
jgi:hypothetical protein